MAAPNPLNMLSVLVLVLVFIVFITSLQIPCESG